MDEILSDLESQHAELAELLDPLDEAGWRLPSPCAGWDVADVVLHLHQTDELAIASLRGDLTNAVAAFVRGSATATAEDTVDTAAAFSVEQARGGSGAEVVSQWRESAAQLRAEFGSADPSARLQWVVGQLSARTLAGTRLSECWIHTGDVATALDRELAPTDRLRHIARLAWRTVPYAFARAERPLNGSVGFDLVGPSGDAWRFGMGEEPSTVVRGDAHELCLLAGRRREPAQTDLVATGPDAAAVMELLRTYA